MAAGRTFSAQKALNTCADHEHEELDMYCKTCKKPVCTKCVKEDHRSHDWDTLAKIAKALRKDTRRCKMEMESVSQSIFIGIEEELQNITTEEESQFEFNQSGIESSRKAIIKTVNKMFDEIKSKSDKDHRTKIKSIKEHKEQMTAKKRRIQFLIQNMETGSRDYTDADLIELHNDIKQLIGELQRIASFPYSWYIKQIYGREAYDESSLANIVGHIKEKEPIANAVLEREFKIGETETNCIRPWSENEACIHSATTTDVKLVNNRGQVKKIFDFNCKFYSFVISDNKMIYCCNVDAKRVDQITTTGQLKILFSTAPLFPLFIILTRSGDLLVTLVDEDKNFRNSSSRRLLRRMSMSGEIIREYEYEEDDKTPLFCSPCSPIEHIDGRVCLIDEFETENGDASGSIYCLNVNGRIVFKYNGIDNDFNPLDICCTPEGNTLVSDSLNRRIHILNSTGTFLKFLLTPEMFDESIYAIACFGSKLWVGSRKTGLIKVFKYTH